MFHGLFMLPWTALGYDQIGSTSPHALRCRECGGGGDEAAHDPWREESRGRDHFRVAHAHTVTAPAQGLSPAAISYCSRGKSEGEGGRGV